MKNQYHVISGFRRYLTCTLLVAAGGFPSLHEQAANPATTLGLGRQGADHPVLVLRRVRGPNHTVTLVRFDYATGRASRVVVDESSKKVLQEQQFLGRPQSSRQEFKEAVRIIQQDPNLRGLIASGAVPEGGFIVDGPSGRPINDRYIQIRLLSPDRRTLLRVTLVDLTAGVVASARASFE
jgi:hypothetical protein